MSETDLHDDRSEPAVLGRDVACGQCGYNLRGIELGGVCPECGTPVAQTLSGNALSLSDPEWLKDMAAGCLAMIASLLGPLVFLVGTVGVTVALTTAAVRSERPIEDFAGWERTLQAIFLAAQTLLALTSLYAYLMLTKAEPNTTGRTTNVPMRRFILMCGALGNLAALALMLEPVLHEQIGETALSLVWVKGLLVLLSLLTVPALPALFAYLERLALRVPNVQLAGSARKVRNGLLACGGLAAVFFLLGLASLIEKTDALSAATGAGCMFCLGFLPMLGWTYFTFVGTFCLLGFAMDFKGAAARFRPAAGKPRLTVWTMSHEQFVERVARAFREGGYEVTVLAPPDNDAFDLTVTQDGKHLVVCTRQFQVRELTSAQLATFWERVQDYGGWEEAIVVTAGRFQDTAEAFAVGKPLRLVDGEALAELLGPEPAADD